MNFEKQAAGPEYLQSCWMRKRLTPLSQLWKMLTELQRMLRLNGPDRMIPRILLEPTKYSVSTEAVLV